MGETGHLEELKKIQFESFLQTFNEGSENGIKEKLTSRKMSTLVLMILQDDKREVDCWDAFGRIGWSKGF